ncbi:MAG: hypothetical protein IKP73_04345 [Bacteroidales bacterium]|nr:hypothetical protein [Bacteroidales bacterium]
MTTLNGVNPNMIANNLKSFKPIHPVEVLKDELEYRALGVDAAPLLAMQNEYDMQMAERNVSFMEKLKQIRRVAAAF